MALELFMSMSKLQQSVTDRIIAKIEEGGLAAWMKPWVDIANKDKAMPYNFKTGNEYQGINILTLLIGAFENGYSHNCWLTFDQALSLGGRVRKGEKSQHCIRYGVYEKEDDHNDKKSYAFVKPFYLFNIEQIDGIEIPQLPDAPIRTIDDSILAIESLVKEECDVTNLGYRIGGNRAFYAPALDLIKMPQGEFNCCSNYAATLAHELIHATGHSKRTNRHHLFKDKFKDDTKASYAFEELVAELGAAMLCAEHGIVGEHLQHESYIDSWFNVLKREPSMLLKAASHASKAHHYLMRRDIEVDIAA